LALEEEKKEREAALAEAREASRKAVEEATQLRERTMTVEEAASKAREEAVFYKDAAADLDKEKGLIKAELAFAREAYREMKVECVMGEIARSAAEEAKKKALEDLEAEQARSRSLSDDVDCLKRALLEKEGAIAQAGKAIEDLRVANTDLARSHREIKRANTDLVGQNTALEEKIRGKLLYTFTLLFCKVKTLPQTLPPFCRPRPLPPSSVRARSRSSSNSARAIAGKSSAARRRSHQSSNLDAKDTSALAVAAVSPCVRSTEVRSSHAP